MPDLALVDWVLLSVLALSVVVGLVRGFLFEVMSLLGWVVAWFGSQFLAPELAPFAVASLLFASLFAVGFFGNTLDDIRGNCKHVGSRKIDIFWPRKLEDQRIGALALCTYFDLFLGSK